MDSKKEYGRNYVVKQSVVWRDTVVEDDSEDQTERDELAPGRKKDKGHEFCNSPTAKRQKRER